MSSTKTRKSKPANPRVWPHYSAGQLLALLRVRHTGDVFADEVKSGPTWAAEMFRLDAWAMNRSWKHLTFDGYECKVSRSDFLNDDKWPAYLPLCHRLWFVTAPGVCAKAEIPEACGWLEMSVTGTRLWRRKQAPRREIQPPTSLLLYLLMSRTSVCDNMRVAGKEDQAAFWRTWLDGKQELSGLGHRVSRALSARIEREIHDRDCKQLALAKRLEVYEDIRQLLQRLGMRADEVNGYYTVRAVEERLAKVRALVPPEVVGECQRLGGELQQLAEALTKAIAGPAADV